MPQELTDLDLNKVSAVDQGANGKRFALLKRDDDQPALPTWPSDPPEERLSLLKRVARALGHEVVGDEVLKAQTFAAIISGQQLSDALYDAWYTLQESMWSAVYAVDENGVELPLDAKQALVSQNLDEFKAWLIAQMETGITKGAGDPADAVATRTFDAFVRKVGKKISAARMARLKEAADALASVLAEVESDDSEAQKRAQPEEDDMTSDELAKALGTALEPITKRLDSIEEAQKASAPAATSTATAAGPVEKTTSDDGDVTLADIAKAIGQIADRVEKLEGGRGERTSATGQDTGAVRKSGTFAGLLTNA